LTADDMPTFATIEWAGDNCGFAFVCVRHYIEARSAVAYKCSYTRHREDNLLRPHPTMRRHFTGNCELLVPWGGSQTGW